MKYKVHTILECSNMKRKNVLPEEVQEHCRLDSTVPELDLVVIKQGILKQSPASRKRFKIMERKHHTILSVNHRSKYFQFWRFNF
jgi:hypothetical protein